MTKKRTAQPSGQVHGVVVVDKMPGLTSFDVVAQARRVFGTRRVGHAGTLDPMATGVLVLLLGEATKFSGVLTTDSKSYRTTIQLGSTTDSLDQDGRITRSVPLPEPLTRERIEGVLQAERERVAQIPPQVSAIKVDGQRSYAQARKGIEVVLAPRLVKIHSLELSSWTETSLELQLTVSKGYYVRSLARDIAERLGTVGHLTALRRLQSGPFREEECSPMPLDPTVKRLTLEETARRCLPIVQLSSTGAGRVHNGQRIGDEHITTRTPSPLSDQDDYSTRPVAAFYEGQIIALLTATDAGHAASSEAHSALPSISPALDGLSLCHEFKVQRGIRVGPPVEPLQTNPPPHDSAQARSSRDEPG